ncbi:putative phage integrase Rve [Candidatus Phytoplasma phoenicium]|uniref:Putative phage integrase Rve n=1 Tax=Candidatus Phytoplasma phoenicium TaxID=198422 RepID=A0A0L0MKQ6_9MOLU|nr:putative phage integrase Rve [Candidatus Phytoplasma phoenicium]
MQKLKQKIKLLQKIIEKMKKIDKKIVFHLVNQFNQTLNLTTILKTIQIKRSTYYYWLKVKNKLKEKEEKYLLQQKRIKALCSQSQYFYGHRKITDLYQKTFNEFITKKKVYTIMKKNDISCRLRIKKNFTYHHLKNNLQIIPNLINQNFMATKPLQKLFTDITYFKTNQDFLYFSCIIDSFNNQIIASHTSNQQNKDLVLNTIKKLPKMTNPCIIHFDQGTSLSITKNSTNFNEKRFFKQHVKKS